MGCLFVTQKKQHTYICATPALSAVRQVLPYCQRVVQPTTLWPKIANARQHSKPTNWGWCLHSVALTALRSSSSAASCRPDLHHPASAQAYTPIALARKKTASRHTATSRDFILYSNTPSHNSQMVASICNSQILEIPPHAFCICCRFGILSAAKQTTNWKQVLSFCHLPKFFLRGSTTNAFAICLPPNADPSIVPLHME